MQTIIDFFRDNWVAGIGIAVIAYELVARLWPTKWNISILDGIFFILAAIIPNRRTS